MKSLSSPFVAVYTATSSSHTVGQFPECYLLVIDSQLLTADHCIIFTAQCTLVQMRGLGIACCPSVCLSVCPSVCNVDDL